MSIMKGDFIMQNSVGKKEKFVGRVENYNNNKISIS